MKLYFIVVTTLFFAMLHFSHQLPIEDVAEEIEREALEKIGKHGTVINIFEAAPAMSPNSYRNDFEDNSADDADLSIKRTKRGFIKDLIRNPRKRIEKLVKDFGSGFPQRN
uniref:Uncharacterized protein n=1 Tax=Panagrolaimus sp. ES5 TaxID=591445 RepID=A0AC34GSQ2_9BILA